MEEAQQKPLATRLSSASDVIDALGGTNIVADMLEIGASSVSNYRKQGFPARSHFILAKICAERGLDVADAVFGGYQVQARPKPYARTPEPATDALTRLEEAGFSRLSLPILQPAAPFIDRMGPEMQRRLFTFTDPGGEQLCLRPDLTIPTALAHIASGKANTRGEARYCYQGTAFRYQPRGSGQPEEFTQLGLEIIGGTNGLEDDLTVLFTIADKLKDAGLKAFRIEFDDADFINLFTRDLELSKRAKERIKWAFRGKKDPEDFASLALSPFKRKTQITSLPDEATIIAGRTGREINERARQLVGQQDESENIKMAVGRINSFITNPFDSEISPKTMRKKFPSITDGQGKHVAEVDEKILRPFMKRYPSSELKYTPNFPTSMAYYTGLSFEIYASGLDRPIATGGRYDDLLQSLGADTPLPAVGGAISLERLARAVEVQ